MNQYLAFGLVAFTSFFTLINPLGVMPIFITMTADLSAKERVKTARKALIVAFIALVAFAFSGRLLFDFFGISEHSFRVAGGIIFFLMGYDMLQARLTKIKVTQEEVKQYVEDISVTPLAIPMICGPGAITNAILMMQDAKDFTLKAILIGVIFFICLLTFLVLWSSANIIKFLGETGNKILMRLMGLIVMVIAVEFFFAGMRPILRSIFLE